MLAESKVHGEANWMSSEQEPGLVSVIIPTYNRAHLITNALESVRRQTYRPIELIVVDDGSTDETDFVVNTWASEVVSDESLEVHYVRKEKGGAPSARNEGLRHAKGEFIQYLDSDDQLAPDALGQDIVEVFSDRGVDLLVGMMRSTRIGILNRRGSSGIGYGILYRHISPNCCLFRRDLVIRIGPWNVELDRHQDRHYMLMVMTYTRSVYYIDRMRYVYNIHSGSRIGSRERDVRYECLWYIKMIKAFESSPRGPYRFYKKELASVYRRVAHLLADIDHYSNANTMLRRSLVVCGILSTEAAKNGIVVLAGRIYGIRKIYRIINKIVRR